MANVAVTNINAGLSFILYLTPKQLVAEVVGNTFPLNGISAANSQFFFWFVDYNGDDIYKNPAFNTVPSYTTPDIIGSSPATWITGVPVCPVNSVGGCQRINSSCSTSGFINSADNVLSSPSRQLSWAIFFASTIRAKGLHPCDKVRNVFVASVLNSGTIIGNTGAGSFYTHNENTGYGTFNYTPSAGSIITFLIYK